MASTNSEFHKLSNQVSKNLYISKIFTALHCVQLKLVLKEIKTYLIFFNTLFETFK